MGERLDKFLTSQGLGTRKEVGKWIRGGLVTVQGSVVRDTGAKVNPDQDVIAVEGQKITYRKHLYVMMNKPAGVLSATEDRRAKTVLDLLPEEWFRRGLFPAGRLDKDTTGLLLITDDGDLAHRMLSPKKHVYKLYRAVVDGPLTERDIEAFSQGVTWGQERYAPARLSLEKGQNCVGLVEIREGRFHQVKRMFASRGREVIQLHRLRIGNLWLDPDLPEGACRLLTPEEVESIFQ